MLSPNNIPAKRSGRASSNWSIDSGYGSGLHEDIKHDTTLNARDNTVSGSAPQQCQQTFGLGIEGLSKLQCDDDVYIKEEDFIRGSTTPRLSLRTDFSNPSSPEPISPASPSESSTSTICAFCELLDPDDDHFQYYHRVGDCMCKAEHERTFGRPDHLQQHARNFHKCEKPLTELVRDAWRMDGPGSVDDKSWTCGFCQEILPNWDARATHIAGHFKAGMSMTQWRDNRVSQSTLPRESTMPEEPAFLDALTGMGATFAGPSNDGPTHANHARVDSGQHQQSQSTSATTFMPMSATIPDIAFDPFCMWGNPIDTFIPSTTEPFSTYTTQPNFPTVTTNNNSPMMDISDVQFDINGNPVFDHGVWNSW
ncbi:hypothetical protein E8E11_005994 [Didymella keratinophila]|nr:hypothetical protein E8E11_005994 [Didymella keratinophila]